MQKRRAFLSIISVVLVLMLALCVFVACNPGKDKNPDNKPSDGDETPTTITITYDYADGVTPNKTATVGYDVKLTEEQLPNVTRVGYEFSGWYYGEERVRVNQRFTQNVTLVAKYKLKDVKVIFVDGETRTPVTIKYGQKVAEDKFPKITEAGGQHFQGWFIKDTETEFDKDYVVNSEEDIEVVAKYDTDKFTVTFKLNADDEDAYKTAQVEFGGTIAAANLPTNPTSQDPTLKFAGWVDPDDDAVVFDKDAEIKSNKTYIAKFVKAKYVVTFKFAEKEDRKDVVRYLEFDANGNAALGELDIPNAITIIDGRSFMGFYTSANVKAVKDMTIKADTTFEAYYVGVIDYAGAWVDETNKIVAYFDTKSNTVSVGTFVDNKNFTAANGTVSYNPTVGDKWTFSFFKGKLTATQTPATGTAKTYNFTQGAKVDYQGVYSSMDGKKLIVGEGGIVASFNGAVQYGKMTKDGARFKITLLENGTLQDSVTINASVDPQGSLVIAKGDYADKYNGIWVKGAYVKTYKGEDDTHIVEFDAEDGKVYVYITSSEFAYATPDKAVATGEIVKFTYNTNKTLIVKFVSANEYDITGYERGSYTLTDGGMTVTIVLDGFGDATLSGMTGDQSVFNGAWAYRVNENNLIVLNKMIDTDEQYMGIVINTQNKTFTVEEPDNYSGKVYKIMQGGGSLELTITFDGLGTVIAQNKTNGTTKYGTYVVNETDGTITINSIGGAQSEFMDGDYTVLQDGKVLKIKDQYTNEDLYWGVDGAVLEG